MLNACLAALLASATVTGPSNSLRVVVPAAQEGGALAALQWEILSAFAKVAGAEVTRVALPDAGAAGRAVAERRADIFVASGGTSVPSGLALSDDVVPTRFVILTRRPAPPVAYLEELRGRAVAAGGPVAQRVAEEAKVHATAFPDASAALAALQDGKADAILVDLFEALALQRAQPALQLGVFVGPRYAVRFAARADDGRLPALNRHLAQLRSSSSWGMLLARHLGPSGMETLGRARLSVR